MSSLGLSTRAASALAYSGWWLTGIAIWLAERRDPVVRFHAAQSLLVFGAAGVLIGLCGLLALASLTFLPSMFGFFVIAAMATWTSAAVLWVVMLWKVWRGDGWRVPIAAAWVARLNAGAFTASRPESA